MGMPRPDIQGMLDFIELAAMQGEAVGQYILSVEAERDAALAEVERLTRERDGAREAGRRRGRAEVGKYDNAIGRIESVLGIIGAVPLAQTVHAVEQLSSRCQRLEAEVAEWKKTVIRDVGGGLNCSVCGAHTVIVADTRESVGWHMGGCPLRALLTKGDNNES